MKCAKCGYQRQSRDDAFVPPGECPACGVVYVKHASAEDPAATLNPVRPPHLKSSPVDAASLLKARERVEKKLRERQSVRVKDERRAQTLRLAKRLTSEQIRRRQDERVHSGTDKQADQKSTAPPEPDSLADNPPRQPNPPAGDRMKPEAARASVPEDEKMTSLEASTPQTVDTSTQTPAAPPEPAGQTAPTLPETTPEDEELPLRQDVVPEGLESPPVSEKPKIYGALTAAQANVDQTSSDVEASQSVELLVAATGQQHAKVKPGKGLTRFLPHVAWLILCAGVIGAVLSWATISDVEAGVHIPISENVSTIPLGLLLGFAYLATGVLGFAFFWVSSLISNQLRDIRRLLIAEGLRD